MLNDNIKMVLVLVSFIAGLIISATYNPLAGTTVLFLTIMLIEFDAKQLLRLVRSRN